MAKKNDDLLRFGTPATWWGESWREGLYLGNGRTSANVYGGANEEKILINDASLTWMGRTTVVPDVSVNVDETRRLIDEGDYMRAERVLLEALEQKNFRPQAEFPLPLCQINAKFTQSGVTQNFCRSLDMASGQATVSFKVADTDYKRDAFVSRADDVFVWRVGKKGNGTISMEFSVSLMHRVNARTYEGICDMPSDVTQTCDRQFYCFGARNDYDCSDYGAVAKITTLGGSVRAEGDKIVVSRAQSVLVIVKTFVGSSREKEFAELKLRLAAIRDGYDKLFRAHQTLHAKLYQTASLSLSTDSDTAIEDLLLATETDKLPPLLVEKIYKYARYLTVAASNADGVLMPPTGLWNGCYKPYRAFKCYNGELQMTYMHALAGNLSQNLEKSFDFYLDNIEDFRNNAQRIFGCRGVVVPVVAAPKTGRLGSTDVYAVHFSGCAAMVCRFYYKYVKYTQNYKFLRQKLLPFMKETARFYEDFISIHDGVAEICPSALPMRVADSYKLTDRPMVAKNSALDLALAKNLLDDLSEACHVLGVKEKKSWRALAAQLPEKQTGGDGTFKEFADSVVSADYTGVSNGTLYEAYFGDSVSFMSSEEERQKYLDTADKKRSVPALQNSFNTTVLGAVYARLGEGDLARQCLNNAVKGCAMSNLAFADKDWRGMGVCGSGVWTPVQLHVNMTFAHVVQQMLLYSSGDLVKVFPALPTDWKKVKFSGYQTESGATVAAEYNGEKNVIKVTLFAKRQTSVILVLPDFAKKITKHNLSEKPIGKELSLSVSAGKEVTIHIKCSAR